MSNQRHIRRPVEDAAVGRVDRKRSTGKDNEYRSAASMLRDNTRKARPIIKKAEIHEHEKENNPVMEKITNPYYNEICQICEYSIKQRTEWYCHQDNPIVSCYQIMTCTEYKLGDEGVITSTSRDVTPMRNALIASA